MKFQIEVGMNCHSIRKGLCKEVIYVTSGVQMAVMDSFQLREGLDCRDGMG